MDVTLLLNSNANSIAAGQQKREESRQISSKNRRPWDAGGYALPVNTILSTPSTPPEQVQRYEARMQTSPPSPRHKFSDSRSSLSSFASSSQSATHSRFSSMSTVSSMHQLNSLDETLSPKSGTKPEIFDSRPIWVSTLENVHPAISRTQERESLSPSLSLDALALVAETRFARHENATKQQPSEVSAMVISSEKGQRNSVERRERLSSPSDAILIKRPAVPILRVNTGDNDLEPAVELVTTNHNHLSAPLESDYNALLHHKTHKRALSAPDFIGPINDFEMSKSPSPRIPMAEPTPPTSHHPDNASPTNITGLSAPPTTPPDAVTNVENQSIVCMYIPNCDTGSQPRKAISHIFGRNKMCTRLIPQYVWVHYCRKHYQRSRYRNPKEYAKLQCDLVQQQIRRVHAWSSNNIKNGTTGVVQDWTLTVRKREQKRLSELGGTKRKLSATFDEVNDNEDEHEDDEQENDEHEDGEDDEHEDDEGDDEENEDGENGVEEDGDSKNEDVSRKGGLDAPSTAVPSWLLAYCGTGYSTQAILDIFNRLHEKVLKGILPCFPDIEILPNIIADQTGPKSSKGHTKKSTSGHKRAKSLGVSVKTEYHSQPSDRRMSHPAVWAHGTSSYGSPVEKRRKLNEMGDINTQRRPMAQCRGRLTERPVDSGRKFQLPHRPIFTDINEHQGGDEEYYAFSSQAYQPPLPAPTPQRMTGQSMAAHLETHNEHFQGARRPVHQRSQPDMSAFGRLRSDYAAPSSAPSYVDYQGRPSPFHEPNPGHGYHASQQYRWNHTAAQSQYNPMRGTANQLPVLGHARLNGQPMVQGYPPQSMQGQGQLSQSQLSSLRSGPNRHTTVQAVKEVPEVRDFYANSARR